MSISNKNHIRQRNYKTLMSTLYLLFIYKRVTCYIHYIHIHKNIINVKYIQSNYKVSILKIIYIVKIV